MRTKKKRKVKEAWGGAPAEHKYDLARGIGANIHLNISSLKSDIIHSAINNKKTQSLDELLWIYKWSKSCLR